MLLTYLFYVSYEIGDFVLIFMIFNFFYYVKTTNLKQVDNKKTLVNLYKDIALSDQSTHFVYDVV